MTTGRINQVAFLRDPVAARARLPRQWVYATAEVVHEEQRWLILGGGTRTSLPSHVFRIRETGQ